MESHDGHEDYHDPKEEIPGVNIFNQTNVFNMTHNETHIQMNPDLPHVAQSVDNMRRTTGPFVQQVERSLVNTNTQLSNLAHATQAELNNMGP